MKDGYEYQVTNSNFDPSTRIATSSSLKLSTWSRVTSILPPVKYAE